MDYSLPGSSVHSILQARLQEWVATGNLPNPGIKPRSPALQVDSLASEQPGRPTHYKLTSKHIASIYTPSSFCKVLASQRHWHTWYIFFIFSLSRSLELYLWRRQWHPTPVLLPGKSHGQRSRVGCSPCWTTSLSLFTFMHWRRKWQPTPVSLPGESQGRGSLVGCHLWGRTELDTTDET